MYFLFLFISFLMISGRSCGKIPVRQCSVFPEIKPKCFPLTYDLKDKKYNTKAKEIPYNKANSYKIIQTTKVEKNGFVEVDDTSLKSWGYYLEDYWCEKDTEKNMYKYDLSYGTNFKYSVRGQDPKNFFITTRRELWICYEDKRRKSVEFHRVVTEHLSKQPIGEIYFHDGTSVVKIPIPKVKADDPQLFTVAIREIKYVMPEYNNRKLNYQGYLTFEPLDKSKSYYKDFKTLSLNTDESETVKVSVNQQQKPEKTIFKQKPLDNTGTPESFMDPNKKAVCKKINIEETDSRLFGVFPMWSHAQETLGAEGKKLGPWKEITPYEFLNYFIVTRYHVMLCIVDTTNETFFRANIRYLATIKVDEAYFSDKEKTVYSFQLPYSTDKSMGIKESFNFMIDNTKKFFDFRGKVRVEPVTQNKKPLGALEKTKSICCSFYHFFKYGFQSREIELEESEGY